MKTDNIISNLCKLENIKEETLKYYLKSFEKYIKSEIKNYDNNAGFEDYKLKKYDYQVLYILYINTKSSPYKIHILLLFMYSFYKMDGLDYSPVNFPTELFFKFLKKNDNIHSLIFQLITGITDKNNNNYNNVMEIN